MISSGVVRWSTMVLPEASLISSTVVAGLKAPFRGKVAKAAAISKVVTPRVRPPMARGLRSMSEWVCPPLST